MKFWLAFTLSLTLAACATNHTIDGVTPGSHPTEISNKSDKETPNNPDQIVKSPHGYVINGPKARFGGFVGDCASEENFPFYWQCQAENAGNDFH